jgi:hypothetical protein
MISMSLLATRSYVSVDWQLLIRESTRSMRMPDPDGAVPWKVFFPNIKNTIDIEQ